VEGNGILTGQANVIVCDAFVGNTIFKFSESGAEIVGKYFKNKMKRYPILSRLLKGKVKGLVASLSLPDSVGAGLIWGVDGIVLKIHGHSRAPDVTIKIAQAKMAVERDVVSCLKSELAKIKKHINL
jgi:glycerol-3-phosphate acyltransferase PlsX